MEEKDFFKINDDDDDTVLYTGQDRELSKFNLSSIHHSLSQSKKGNKEPVVVRPLDSGSACTVFAVKQTQDGLFVCAATVDKIILYKYNSSLKDFCIRRVGNLFFSPHARIKFETGKDSPLN